MKFFFSPYPHSLIWKKRFKALGATFKCVCRKISVEAEWDVLCGTSSKLLHLVQNNHRGKRPYVFWFLPPVSKEESDTPLETCIALPVELYKRDLWGHFCKVRCLQGSYKYVGFHVQMGFRIIKGVRVEGSKVMYMRSWSFLRFLLLMAGCLIHLLSSLIHFPLDHLDRHV